MTDSYYNTTSAKGKRLAQYEGKASTQEERIYEFFRQRPSRNASPSQVQSALGMHGTPITSIRRAITNLTSRGKLMKTDNQVTGTYGRPEYQWTLAKGQLRLL